VRELPGKSRTRSKKAPQNLPDPGEAEEASTSRPPSSLKERKIVLHHCPLHKNEQWPNKFCLAFHRTGHPPSHITSEEDREKWGIPQLDASNQFYHLKTPVKFKIPAGPAIFTIDLGFEMWLDKDHQALLQLDLEGALASGGLRGKVADGCLTMLAHRGKYPLVF
jgi:hypothetical protein